VKALLVADLASGKEHFALPLAKDRARCGRSSNVRRVEKRGPWEDSLRGSSVKIGTIQRRLAWPLRKDDTHKSRSVNKQGPWEDWKDPVFSLGRWARPPGVLELSRGELESMIFFQDASPTIWTFANRSGENRLHKSRMYQSLSAHPSTYS